MLKIGIVGVGHFGKYHLNCLKTSENFKLMGFYDIDTDVCEQVKEEYGVPYFRSFEEMIRNIDVLDVVTPASTHFDYAQQAVSQNKHVFIEKPLAKSYTEAKQLFDMLDEHKVKIQVGHIERFNPAYTAAMPYLDSPVRVEVERNGTYNLRNKDVSVIEDLMIHDIDILIQTVKSPIKKITAEGSTVKSSSFDIVDVVFEFENGALAHLKANRVAETPYRAATFYHSGNYVSVDYMNKKTEVHKLNGHAVNGNGVHKMNGNGVLKPEIREINAIKEELDSFYNSIVNDIVPPVTIYDSMSVMKICEDIKKKISA